MATLNGVYSASVVENRDPEGLARVLVRVSALTDVIGGDLWARMASMMAGRNRGTWFIPDVGDEVLVAFERGDVKEAYVIGALWNAKARPPAESPVDVKLIRSRNGITLRFKDDRNNNAVIIETPAGQRITLQDNPGSVRIEDANGNSVMLSPSGMTVNASATVTVNASRMEVSAAMLTVNAGMSRFSGVVQCDTMISNSVISASYTPGAGNLW
jgi:uncharacterized protein involved in type VI secretion and phage assembly